MRKDVQKLPSLYPCQDVNLVKDTVVLGWPNALGVALRYSALLSAIDFGSYSAKRPLRLLDLGCGLGLLLDWLAENGLLDSVDYTGVDLVEPMIEAVRGRWPDQRFELRDVRDEPFADNAFDYCIVCGIFTVKHGNTYDETVNLAQSTLRAVWPSVSLGIAFHSMSKHVDWERDDLFHWPLDDIMAFCKRDLSRHVTFKLDTGQWDVSTLVHKQPVLRSGKVPPRW
jgi:SAM-dependent methyltransferase